MGSGWKYKMNYQRNQTLKYRKHQPILIHISQLKQHNYFLLLIGVMFWLSECFHFNHCISQKLLLLTYTIQILCCYPYVIRECFSLSTKSIEKVSKSQFSTWYRYRSDNFGDMTILLDRHLPKAFLNPKRINVNYLASLCVA